MKGEKVKISVLVVGFNEGGLLRGCLESVGFCDEVVYVDLGSGDGSLEIAGELVTRVVGVAWSPVVEPVHARMFGEMAHEWVMLVDPDERISPGLQSRIRSLPEDGGMEDAVGAYSFPWRFYFGQRRLRGTPWGYQNRKVLLIHRDRFELSGAVHSGRKIRSGYEVQLAGDPEKEYVDHFWVSGWKELIRKHKRYLTQEGQARYEAGGRPVFRTILITPFRKFRYSYFTKKGYRDGVLGFALSVFYGWYEGRAMVECWRVKRLKGLEKGKKGKREKG